jgi:hypothetical protein
MKVKHQHEVAQFVAVLPDAGGYLDGIAGHRLDGQAPPSTRGATTPSITIRT